MEYNNLALTCPTYHHLHEASLNFGKQLKEFIEKDNTLVVGIARGGLFMANVLSHQLNVPVVVVNYSSPNGKGEYKKHNNKLPKLKQQNLIIVDDICDSGYTLSEVRQAYHDKLHEVVTAVFYTKENSIYVPDLTKWTISADFDWIEFPWEDTIIV